MRRAVIRVKTTRNSRNSYEVAKSFGKGAKPYVRKFSNLAVAMKFARKAARWPDRELLPVRISNVAN